MSVFRNSNNCTIDKSTPFLGVEVEPACRLRVKKVTPEAKRRVRSFFDDPFNNHPGITQAPSLRGTVTLSPVRHSVFGLDMRSFVVLMDTNTIYLFTEADVRSRSDFNMDNELFAALADDMFTVNSASPCNLPPKFISIVSEIVFDQRTRIDTDAGSTYKDLADRYEHGNIVVVLLPESCADVTGRLVLGKPVHQTTKRDISEALDRFCDTFYDWMPNMLMWEESKYQLLDKMGIPHGAFVIMWLLDVLCGFCGQNNRLSHDRAKVCMDFNSAAKEQWDKRVGVARCPELIADMLADLKESELISENSKKSNIQVPPPHRNQHFKFSFMCSECGRACDCRPLECVICDGLPERCAICKLFLSTRTIDLDCVEQEDVVTFERMMYRVPNVGWMTLIRKESLRVLATLRRMKSEHYERKEAARRQIKREEQVRKRQQREEERKAEELRSRDRLSAKAADEAASKCAAAAVAAVLANAREEEKEARRRKEAEQQARLDSLRELNAMCFHKQQAAWQRTAELSKTQQYLPENHPRNTSKSTSKKAMSCTRSIPEPAVLAKTKRFLARAGVAAVSAEKTPLFGTTTPRQTSSVAPQSKQPYKGKTTLAKAAPRPSNLPWDIEEPVVKVRRDSVCAIYTPAYTENRNFREYNAASNIQRVARGTIARMEYKVVVNAKFEADTAAAIEASMRAEVPFTSESLGSPSGSTTGSATGSSSSGAGPSRTYRPRQCRNGPGCQFLKRGTCLYFHDKQTVCVVSVPKQRSLQPAFVPAPVSSSVWDFPTDAETSMPGPSPAPEPVALASKPVALASKSVVHKPKAVAPSKVSWFECNICFELRETKIALVCGHVMCPECCEHLKDNRCFTCAADVGSMRVKLFI
eukprot:5228546-Prymnesium_polylepis.5